MKKFITIFIELLLLLFLVNDSYAYSPGHCRDIYGAGAIEIGDTCGCAKGYIKTGIPGVDGNLCSLDNKTCQNIYGTNSIMQTTGICGCKSGYQVINGHCKNLLLECQNRFGEYSTSNLSGGCRCKLGYKFSKSNLSFLEITNIINQDKCIKDNSTIETYNENNQEINDNLYSVIEEDKSFLSQDEKNNYLESASKLASKGIITYQNNSENYNVEDTITRREILKIVIKISGKNVGDSCEGKFKDLSSSDWGCKYAESALDYGFISSNNYFRPNDKITKIEAIKMILKAKNISVDITDDWRVGYVSKGVELGLFNNFTDYNSNVIRGFIFDVSGKLIDYTSGGEDIDLNELLDDLYNESESDEEVDLDELLKDLF